MKVNIEKNDRYIVLTINEKNFTSANVSELKSEFAIQIAAGNHMIILNLEQVEFLDSSGLGAILNGDRNAKEHGGVFVIYGVNENVMTLFKIAKLDKVLSITGTKKEAIDLLIMEELERDLKGES